MTPAQRALDQFDSRNSIRSIVGSEAVQYSATGDNSANDALYSHFERNTKLDGKTFKLWRKVAAKFPQHAEAIEAVLAEATTLIIAAKAEAVAEKAAKAVRAGERIAKARNVTRNGVQLGKVTMEAFETLATILAPVRVQYAEAASSRACTHIASIQQRVVDCGSFDAAYPSLTYAQDKYGFANVARSDARHILKDTDAYVKQCMMQAEADVDAFVIKLAGKIGSKVLSGTVRGSLWQNSILDVVTESGAQQWYTQCIINTSVNGKAFNQWPTRRSK